MATLTPAQKTTLKNDIIAKSANGQPLNGLIGNWDAVAAYYNALTSPAIIVWRTNVSKAEIIAATTFDWTRVDNLSVGKARIWDELFSAGNVNPSQANVRLGFDATWAAAGDAATLAGIYVVIKRTANRFEALFATGTGTTPVPANMAVEGNTTAQQLSDVYGS